MKELLEQIESLRNTYPINETILKVYGLAHEQAKKLAELEKRKVTGISINDKLPDTYTCYDCHGNDLIVSDCVITNKGVACYCLKHDLYGDNVWIDVDWDYKDAGKLLTGITHWALIPTIGE